MDLRIVALHRHAVQRLDQASVEIEHCIGIGVDLPPAIVQQDGVLDSECSFFVEWEKDVFG